MILSISKNRIVFFLCFLLVVSILFNLVGYWKTPKSEPNFSLLDPSIAQLDIETFRAQQSYYTTQLAPLRKQLNETLQAQRKGVYSIYFENLNTGAWIGINEKTPFVPASLLKVPLVAAVLKKAQTEELDLNTLATVRAKDLNYLYGAIGLLKEGETHSILEFINYTLYYSDNTAANVLMHYINSEEYLDGLLNLGLPIYNLKNFSQVHASAKDYGNILRSLYYASYLRRTYSQLILSTLTHTNFRNGLPAGLPADIKIAHKVGYFIAQQGEQHHDCGIVYYPGAPYLLCVMTQGLTQEEADRLAAQISKISYTYVHEKMG